MTTNHIDQMIATETTINEGNYTPIPIGIKQHIYNNGYTIIPR